MSFILKSLYRAVNPSILIPKVAAPSFLTAGFHTTPELFKDNHIKGPKRFEKYNKVIYPPQEPHEEPRTAVSRQPYLVRNEISPSPS